MRKSLVLKAFIFLFLSSLLPAFEESLMLGTDDGWSSLVMMDGVVLNQGWEGYSDIILADGEYSLSGSRKETDLLLHFNGPGTDMPGSSWIVNGKGDENYGDAAVDGGNKNFSYREKVLGNASLALQSSNSPLIIFPMENAVLARDSRPEDFSIEFWIYPARLSEGEEVFAWEGGWWDDGDFLSQGISCMVAGQKLLWKFRNFFLPPAGAETQFSLHGDTALLPRKWHHHLVRYDSLTGLLEYLIDGKPEAVIHTTPTGHENGEIYLPVCGALADTEIQLGRGYIGLIDELRISSHWVEEPMLDRFPRQEGAAVTGVFDLEQSETRILRINTRNSLPGNSDIYYYYRVSDELFGESDERLPWHEFSGGESLSGEVSGRYIQLRAELLPDGTGMLSPAVSSMEIVYQLKLPPLPPAYVTAVPGDGSVHLKWNAMSNGESRGFRIFFGERPGIYFGTSSDPLIGVSPLDVGNVTEYTINGLDNGRIYYFTIMAYTGSYGDLTSEFSREVSARPSALHRTNR